MTATIENPLTGAQSPPQKKRFHTRSLVWIVGAIIVLLIPRLVPDAFVDKWYYFGLFGWIRRAYDFVLGWSPIPMIYFVLLIVVVRSIFWLTQWKYGFTFQMTRLLGGVSCLIVLFYILWGFNYQQVPLQDRLGFSFEEVSQEDIAAEFQRASTALEIEAMHLKSAFRKDSFIRFSPVFDRDLRQDVEEVLGELGVPNKGHVRVRQLYPKGFLLRWSTAGIYIPQSMEGHIDKGLLSVQKPFTMAHEMAHGYGVTDEGACNFIAWLACSQSKDPWIRYGGAFTYWRYAAAEMPDSLVLSTLDNFDPVVMRSIQLVRDNDAKYPDIMPKIRDAIYSSYLKRHGVRGGLKSYNYVVMMVSQYLKRKNQPG